jgi:hypothetical protein
MAPAKSFTPKQGQYLAFIYAYTRLHRRPPHTDTTEGLGASASSRGRTRSAEKDLKESD